MSAEEDEFGNWVRDCYAPSVKIIAGAVQEATGCSDENADDFARSVLARLCAHDKPITVKLLEIE